ncbi:MAG: (d)CMP kinase [Bifidobacteriaceae bacterium]|jgi:cytidylate kinase|nr:(d)CMP kinase [Bifidobacteriaceae bacterium]
MTVVAIDGPSGSGKSTVAKALANQLGWAYLDTGAMYRAAAIWIDQAGALDQPDRMAALIEQMPLEISLDPVDQRFYLDGVDITDAIRTSATSRVVSKVATNIPSRHVLVAKQQQLAAANAASGIVVEGRDITTVVAPDAAVRILLTASPEARLRRRALEQHGQADSAAIAATTDEVIRRDRDDSTVAQFMDAPPGVTLLDTTDLSIEEAVAAALALVEQA